MGICGSKASATRLINGLSSAQHKRGAENGVRESNSYLKEAIRYSPGGCTQDAP